VVPAAGGGWDNRRLTVLALIHDTDAGPGVFYGYDEVASFSLGTPPAHDAHDAVMVFGGEANVDDDFDWLREEKAWIADLLERGTPLLGVCLGAQLIAEGAGARVERLPAPEIGWHEVEKVGLAFEWHRYGFEHAPPGATEEARNEVGCQAFRLGNARAIQFHAEVDEPTVMGWIRDYGPADGVDGAALAAQTRREIGRWNEYGRALCERFLSSLSPARRAAGRR
jgi:GMP synthase-like glutamine amidotransferase